MIDLQKQDGVFVLRMKSGENRFNLEFLATLNRALDEVERSEDPTALVTTGEGKFYSNGLDLDWMSAAGAERATENIAQVHALLGRLLAFPVITVGALNGHAFAAGAMLAIAHDFRVMRNDRGYFCLPEVDIRIPFTPAMSAVITARLSKSTAHEAMVTGKRYTAEEALRSQIVQQIAPEQEVLPAAIALAKSLAGKHRPTLTAIKQTMYRSTLDAIAAHAAT
jgi:enoyl-CoA hydratase/carnithine racemase